MDEIHGIRDADRVIRCEIRVEVAYENEALMTRAGANRASLAPSSRFIARENSTTRESRPP